MTVRALLTKVLESATFKLLKDFKEVIGLAVFYFAFVAAPASPQLLVSVHESEFLLSTSEEGTSRPPSNTASRPKLLTIFLENDSSKPIENLELTIVGLAKVIRSGVRTSSLHLRSTERDLANLQEIGSKEHLFSHLRSIPAHNSIELQVLGDFQPLFLSTRVGVRSSASGTRLAEATCITGIRAIVFRHLDVLALILGICLLVLGFRRLAPK